MKVWAEYDCVLVTHVGNNIKVRSDYHIKVKYIFEIYICSAVKNIFVRGNFYVEILYTVYIRLFLC